MVDIIDDPVGTTSDYPLHLQELEVLLTSNPGNCEVREQLGRELCELGHEKAGYAHLCMSAELRAEREEFREAVSILYEVLKANPEHQRAKQLLPKFYARVPRQPTAKLQIPSLHEDTGSPSIAESGEYGAALFGLPEESLAALAQLLPFSEEDPKPIVGPIEVPLLEESSEFSLPLLIALDTELRTDDIRRTADHMRVSTAPRGADAELEDAFRFGIEDDDRISPASAALSIDDLPPNPIVSLLDSEPLQRLLNRVDLVNVAAGERVTPKQALYVIIKGQFHLQAQEALNDVPLELLEPGDFFGEFELLSMASADTEVLATQPSSILELPARIIEEIASDRPAVRELLREAFHSRAFHSVMLCSKLFSDLPREVMSRIAVELEPLRFQPGDIVFREGEKPQGLYAVVGGNVAVVSAENEGSVLARLVPGEFFGTPTSDWETDPTKSTVVTTEDCTLLWLPPWSLAPLRDTLPGFSFALNHAKADPLWHHKLV